MEKNEVGSVRSFTDLPPELQSEILLRLPVKSILICKCVCKSFRSLISSPNFVQSHLMSNIDSPPTSLILHSNRDEHLLLHTINRNPQNVSLSFTHLLPKIPDGTFYRVSIAGSCNGLILVAVLIGYTFNEAFNPEYILILWNPVIKQHRILPQPPKISHCLPEFGYVMTHCLHEFGFVPETNDYVVLKIGQSPPLFQVYKMSSDSWIAIDCSPRELDLINKRRRGVNHVFLNGSFHWEGCDFDDTNILYYNLKDDELGVIKAVDCSRVKYVGEYYSEFVNRICVRKLAVVDQSLAMIYHHKEQTFPIEIWVMNDYGVDDSWSLRYRISDDNGIDCYSYCLAGYWTRGLMIINQQELEVSREADYLYKLVSTFWLYDVNARSRVEIERMGDECLLNGFCSFMETLVPVIKVD